MGFNSGFKGLISNQIKSNPITLASSLVRSQVWKIVKNNFEMIDLIS